MGMQSELGPICYQFGFNSGTPGVNKMDTTNCFGNQFILPVGWKSFTTTSKSITVRGKIWSDQSLMGCTAYVVSSAGNVVSQATGTFSNTNPDNFQDIVLNVTSVTSGTTTFVSCTSIGSTTVLMNYRYTP